MLPIPDDPAVLMEAAREAREPPGCVEVIAQVEQTAGLPRVLKTTRTWRLNGRLEDGLWTALDYTELGEPEEGGVSVNFGAAVEAGARAGQIMRQAAHDMEIEDAEKDILKLRRDAGLWKKHKQQEKVRHERLDKQHEIEKALQFAEEEIEDGQNFMNDALKNIFGGSKKKQKQ